MLPAPVFAKRDVVRLGWRRLLQVARVRLTNVADELSKFIVEMMGSHREGERVVDGVTV